MTEFKPNWTIAPADTLREVLEKYGLTPKLVAAASGPKGTRAEREALINEVLAREPLTELHAGILESGTQVPARMWLALERLYREGLAAGLIDTSEGVE
jgi:hypothetical protein